MEEEEEEEEEEEKLKREMLQTENEELQRQNACKVCLDLQVSVLFLPCGHLAVCHVCSPAMETCPMCRQPVKGRALVLRD